MMFIARRTRSCSIMSTSVRDSEQLARARRLVAARRARRRAERTACVAREAALQASLAHASLM